MVVLCFFNFSVILSFDFWLGYKILLGWKCPSKFFESWTFYLITFVTNGASFRRVVFLETFIRTKQSERAKRAHSVLIEVEKWGIKNFPPYPYRVVG